MLYKTKLKHDRWYQLSELIYSQKFQKAGMSISADAKSYYVKNSGVNSVIIYIHMNILKMNVLDFPSLKKQFSAMCNYLCWRYFSIWTCTYIESTCFLEPVGIAKISKKTLNLAQKSENFPITGSYWHQLLP